MRQNNSVSWTCVHTGTVPYLKPCEDGSAETGATSAVVVVTATGVGSTSFASDMFGLRSMPKKRSVKNLPDLRLLLWWLRVVASVAVASVARRRHMDDDDPAGGGGGFSSFLGPFDPAARPAGLALPRAH